MDKDADEMQRLRAGGILSESLKLIASPAHRRLLASLAALLVLPLSLVMLGHTLLTDPLLAQIGSNLDILSRQEQGSPYAARTQHLLSWELSRLVLMLLLYFIFLLALSLVSTAAIVYSMACIYLDRQLGIKLVLDVVPRVWKRLMVTFVFAFLLMLLYQVVFLSSLVLAVVTLGDKSFGLLVVLGLVFLVAHVYLNLVWHLASVVTVLEEHYGVAALRKSVNLIKGRRGVGLILIFAYMLVTGFISALFRGLVVAMTPAEATGWTSRVMWGTLLVLALTVVNLVGLLAQTLFYFSVKAYHHESIDRLLLSDQLDAYLGDYVALKDPPTIAMGRMQHQADNEEADLDV